MSSTRRSPDVPDIVGEPDHELVKRPGLAVEAFLEDLVQLADGERLIAG
jgi:hypothetical protein